ncbi:hypothetical protein Tco_0506148 [Tanacetum coccineum]
MPEVCGVIMDEEDDEVVVRIAEASELFSLSIEEKTHHFVCDGGNCHVVGNRVGQHVEIEEIDELSSGVEVWYECPSVSWEMKRKQAPIRL